MPRTCSNFMSWDCSCISGCVTLHDTSLLQLARLAAIRGPENMPFHYIQTLYLDLTNSSLWIDTFRHFQEYDIASWSEDSWKTTFKEMLDSSGYYIPYIVGLKLIARYSTKLSQIRLLVDVHREYSYSYPEYVQCLQALCHTFPKVSVCLNFGLFHPQIHGMWDQMNPVLKLDNIKELDLGIIRYTGFWDDLLHLRLNMPLLETLRANFQEQYFPEYWELSRFFSQFPHLRHLFLPGHFSSDFSWRWLPKQIQTLKLGIKDYDKDTRGDRRTGSSDSDDDDRAFRTYTEVTSLVYDGGMAKVKFDVEFPNVKYLQLGTAQHIRGLKELVSPCSRTLSTLALHDSTYSSACRCLGLVDCLEMLVVSKAADRRDKNWRYIKKMIPDLTRMKVKFLYLDMSPVRDISISDALKYLTENLEHLEQLYFEVPEKDVPVLEALGLDKRLSIFCGVCNYPSISPHHRGFAVSKAPLELT